MGRGFDKNKDACNQYDASLPDYEINEDGIMVLCKACEKFKSLLNNDNHHDQPIDLANEQFI